MAFLGVLCLLATPASAFDKRQPKIGLGVELGDPTGLTAKYYFEENLALQGGAGLFTWPYGPGAYFDLLYEIPYALNTSKTSFELPVFFGAGFKGGGYYHCTARLRRIDDCDFDAFLGLRVPVGIAMQFKQTPLEIQLEFAPVVYGPPVFFFSDLDADLSLAIRYYY